MQPPPRPPPGLRNAAESSWGVPSGKTPARKRDVPFPHGTYIMAAQPDSAQHVHLKEAAPIVVGDLFKRLRFEDAKIVHQDVDAWETRNDSTCACFGAQVRGDSVCGAADLHCLVDSLSRAAVNDDHRALFGQRGSNGQANAGSGASDKSRLAFQL